MLKKIKESKKIIDLIYAYEPLCYYFGMHPNEYWDNRIKDNIIYVQSQMANKLDSIRESVKLAEIATNKLIKADAMSTRRPDIINIQDSYESIFEKKTEEATPDDMVRAFRNIIKKEKG